MLYHIFKHKFKSITTNIDYKFDRLALFRILFIAITLIFVVFGFLLRNISSTNIDNLSMKTRFIFSSLFLITFLLSYRVNFIKNNLDLFFIFCLYIMTLHLIYLGYISNYRIDIYLSIVVIILTSNLIIKSKKRLFYYNIITMLSLLFAIFLTSLSNINKIVLSIFIVLAIEITRILSTITLKMESKLRHNNEILHFALESSGSGVWDYNFKTNKACISPQIKKMLGIDNDSPDLKYKNWSKLIHPNDLKETCKKFHDHLEGKSPIFTTEYRVKQSDKTYKWFLTQGKVMSRDNEGQPIRIVGTIADIDERKKAEERLKYCSMHDDLTGLYNRAFFEEELERLNTKRQLPLTLILGDANGLKMVNDTFGHQDGDIFLKDVATILKKACREEDIIARIGGDEFAIILPKVKENEAKKIIQRIKSECEIQNKGVINPTISLGYATKTSHQQNIEKIYEKADKMMYKNKMSESKDIKNSIISNLKETLEERTNETKEHNNRMKKLSLIIGKKIGLKEKELSELEMLATLHDIGKIAVPDRLLKKREKLSKSEFETIQKHCEIGFRIASTTPQLSSIAEPILSHHEHWDGNGYPRQLQGTNIPLISRIVSIVDSYDAMTHDRPYRKALSKDEAIKELKRCSGKQFDPKLTKIFIEIISNYTEVKSA